MKQEDSLQSSKSVARFFLLFWEKFYLSVWLIWCKNDEMKVTQKSFYLHEGALPQKHHLSQVLHLQETVAGEGVLKIEK